jgi:hypothetical protein
MGKFFKTLQLYSIKFSRILEGSGSVARQFSRVNSAPDNSARSIQPQTIQLKNNSAQRQFSPSQFSPSQFSPRQDYKFVDCNNIMNTFLVHLNIFKD